MIQMTNELSIEEILGKFLNLIQAIGVYLI